MSKRELIEYFSQAESVFGSDRRSRFPIQHSTCPYFQNISVKLQFYSSVFPGRR